VDYESAEASLVATYNHLWTQQLLGLLLSAYLLPEAWVAPPNLRVSCE